MVNLVDIQVNVFDFIDKDAAKNCISLDGSLIIRMNKSGPMTDTFGIPTGASLNRAHLDVIVLYRLHPTMRLLNCLFSNNFIVLSELGVQTRRLIHDII